jgi:hypothetical protein
MQSYTVSITDDGVMRFLVSPETEGMITDASTVRRASHVEPVSPGLRVLFHGLRMLFGEYGRMASFTRAWPCYWRVNLSPIGGPVLPGVWRDRADAIAAEVEHLNAHFI